MTYIIIKRFDIISEKDILYQFCTKHRQAGSMLPSYGSILLTTDKESKKCLLARL